MRITRLFFLLLTSTVYYATAQERINSFSSVVTINQDATLDVQETIEVISTGKTVVHGIVREFPTTYRDHLGTTYRVDFSVKSVRRNNTPEPFTLKSADNGQLLYIGDKKVTIPTGKHRYTITYRTNRQLGFFKEYDELYWNISGTGWRLPIDSVEATINLPTKALSAEAYTGKQGAKKKDYSYSIQNNHAKKNLEEVFIHLIDESKKTEGTSHE